MRLIKKVGNLTKTNNDSELLEAKVSLRIQSLPEKSDITVLEAFGGEGILWSAVKRRCPEKNIQVLSIDKNKYKRVQLQGDNLKYLSSFNLNEFDIIDLDAWGSPVKQLEIIFSKQYRGIVHCTFIQSMHGNLSRELLYANGYTEKMLAKITSIFITNGLQKFYNYLYNRGGVKKLTIISENRKNYLFFSLNPQK
jgi:hypothetical protein